MKILLAGLVKNPQVQRIREEAEKREHTVHGCYSSDLAVYSDTQSFEVTLRGEKMDYDLIYLWTLGNKRWEWYIACRYLNQKLGTVIVNKSVTEEGLNSAPTPLLSFEQQLANSLPYPASAVVFKTRSAESVIEKFTFPVIVKKSNGRQGRGVFLAQNIASVERIIKENREKTDAFIIREFIPNDGDIRVFTVGCKAIGAMKRIPKEGEFRSNISQGGRGELFDLQANPDIQKLAEKASEVTKTEIAGVDIIIHKKTGKFYLLEVNPGPQFLGIEKYTGINIAEKIVKYFEGSYSSQTAT